MFISFFFGVFLDAVESLIKNPKQFCDVLNTASEAFKTEVLKNAQKKIWTKYLNQTVKSKQNVSFSVKYPKKCFSSNYLSGLSVCISKRVMWITSKYHQEKYFLCIFLQSTHQVDMKNVVKYCKHFLGCFNTLETHSVQITILEHLLLSVTVVCEAKTRV